MNIADLFKHRRQQLADDRAGLCYPAENVLGQTEAGDDLSRPVAGARIKQSARRSDGVLILLYTCQEVVEQVGHKEHIASHSENLGVVALLGEQLKYGIEIHGLNSRNAVELVLTHGLERLLGHTRGALVTIVTRVCDKTTVLIEEAVIDTPCVYRDRCDILIRAERAVADGILDLVVDTQDVPVESSRNDNGIVREAVILLKSELFAVKSTYYSSSARSAEVDGEHLQFCHSFFSF